MNFPANNYYADGMHVTVNSQDNMVTRGMDPKPLVIDFCKPNCIYWKEKLERCEAKLAIVIKTNPTKSCMYPMRDWVTCIEACVSAKSPNQLPKVILHTMLFNMSLITICFCAGPTESTQRARRHAVALL